MRHVCALLVALLLGLPAFAKTFTVNSTADAVAANPASGVCETAPGNGVCTLRAAIQVANALPGPDTIIVPAGTYTLTIPGQAEDAAASGDLDITDDLTITGSGAATTIIQACAPVAPAATCTGIDRVFHVDPAGKLISATISGVTIQNGTTTLISFVLPNGGAILLGFPQTLGNPVPSGSLTLVDCVVRNSQSPRGGGGIAVNAGTLTLIRTTVSGNTGATAGGGIFLGDFSKATLTGSTISDNQSDQGGGIFVGGFDISISGTQLTITNSTVSNNLGNVGGGIFRARGAFIVTNSTISGNSANTGGGGIKDSGFNNGPDVLNNITVTKNTSTGGGSVLSGGISGGPMTVMNSIIAGNGGFQNPNFPGGPDCNGSIISGGHNLIQVTTACSITGDTASNIIGKDPLLGLLADNGGPTLTAALGAGSPAINAGSPAIPGSGGTACAASDQRGDLRPFGAACDIGAYERASGLTVSAINSKHGGDTGQVLVVVSGTGFVNGSLARLSRAGQPDILSTASFADPGSSALSGVFDLTGRTDGLWDLTVTNPDGAFATLPGSFTIEPAQTPIVWTQVVGRSGARAGATARFTVLYGNRSNTDAYAVPITISTPVNYGLLLYTPVLPPPSQSGQVISDWNHAPLEVNPATTIVNVPLLLPVIPAGFTGSFEIGLTVPATAQHGQTFQFSVSHGDPFFAPNLDPTVEAQMIVGAQSYAQQSLGVTPSPAIAGKLQAYIENQMSLVKANGLNALATVQGSQTQLYSLAELLVDAGEYAATTPPAPALIHSFAAPGVVPPTGGGCTGGVLQPGQTCNADPTPVPDPKTPPPPKGISVGECLSIPKHHVSADGSTCVPNKGSNCAIIPNPLFTDPDCTRIPIITSVDPNDKVGSAGLTPTHYVSRENPLAYTILFENLATATASAQRVVITDHLDTSNLDLSTFSFGPVSFGGVKLNPVPQNNHFVGGVDLRPDQNLIVKIEGTLDPATGLLSWVFTSLDPVTLQTTTDPIAGFLPPNSNPPTGEGAVRFTVMPKPGITSGTTTCNQATVVFDTNASINTPTWCNSYDFLPPTSQVQALPAQEQQTSFPVTWSGTDRGSGVASFTIYVSDNGGPFTAFQTDTTATSATFSGQVGHTYALYSIARDLVGNVEGAKSAAEATTQVGQAQTDTTPPVTTAVSSPGTNLNGWNNSDVTVTLNGADETGGSGFKQITYSASGAQTIASTIFAGGSTSFTISTEGITTITFFGTDNAGNIETAKTITVKLDKTPRNIAGTRIPAPNVNGWNNIPVTVSFLCADGISGLAAGSPPTPTTLSHEGAAQSVTGACQDLAGNTSMATISGINIDKTPPILTVTSNLPPNANGWNNSDVTVSFAAVDALSGVGVVSAPVTVSSEGVGQVVVGSASDLAGNLTSGSVSTNLDKTPPEAFNQFDPVTHDVVLFGRDALSGAAPGPIAPVSVVAMRADGDEDDRDDIHDADDVRQELRTYQVLDLAGNSLQLVERVKKNKHRISVRIVSLQYGQGPVAVLRWNRQSFDWELAKDGSLRELEQRFRTGPSEESPRVEAEFAARTMQTRIVQEEPEPKTRVVKSGLALLRMATTAGKLSVEF